MFQLFKELFSKNQIKSEEAKVLESIKAEIIKLRAKGILYKDMFNLFEITPKQFLELIKDKDLRHFDNELKNDAILSDKAMNINTMRKLLCALDFELRDRNLQKLKNEDLLYGYHFLSEVIRREESDFLTFNNST